MTALSTFFRQKKSLQKPDTYYIVKDDFIVNLKRGRIPKHKISIEKNENTLPIDVTNSEVMVKKKYELLRRMKDRSNNNFYDLDKQIENNREALYRKMNVALRKCRVECKIKLENPFARGSSSQLKESHCSENQEKNLSRLIFNVQPYWVKRSFCQYGEKIVK